MPDARKGAETHTTTHMIMLATWIKVSNGISTCAILFWNPYLNTEGMVKTKQDEHIVTLGQCVDCYVLCGQVGVRKGVLIVMKMIYNQIIK